MYVGDVSVHFDGTVEDFKANTGTTYSFAFQNSNNMQIRVDVTNSDQTE